MKPITSPRVRSEPFARHRSRRCRVIRSGSRRRSTAPLLMLALVGLLPFSATSSHGHPRGDSEDEVTPAMTGAHGVLPLLAENVSGPFIHFPPGGGPALATPPPERTTPSRAPTPATRPTPSDTATESPALERKPSNRRPAPPARAAISAEATAWRNAWSCGTIFCYHDYLDRYPTGRNAEKARDRIRAILGP